MRKLLFVIPIAIAIVTAAGISFSVVLAQKNEKGDSNANTLANKVAQILGLDAAVVNDAFNQARKELKDEAGQKLKAMVENGDITREQAAAKLKAFNHSKAKQMPYLKGVRQRLKAAVEQGEITQDQADARLEGFKTRAD